MRIPKTIDVVHAGPGALSSRVPREPFVEGLEEPDQDRAEHGPREVADAPEHGGRERDQAEREPVVEADGRVVEGEDHARGAGEPTGDQERERDRPVDVDAHHGRGVLVLRRRPHRLALRVYWTSHMSRTRTGTVTSTTNSRSHV